MCTAALSLIGPVMNLAVAGQQARLAQQQAELAAQQAAVEREQLLEQYREQSRQYETNKVLAQRTFDVTVGQIDEQTIENVKETQRQAFDQLLLARDVTGQMQSTNASLNRQGVSVGDAERTIEAEGARNQNRLHARRRGFIKYGERMKEAAQDDYVKQVESVPKPRLSPTSFKAVHVRHQANVLGARQTHIQAMGTAVGAVSGFVSTLSNIQSMQSQSAYNMQGFSNSMAGLGNTMQVNRAVQTARTAGDAVRMSTLLGKTLYGGPQ